MEASNRIAPAVLRLADIAPFVAIVLFAFLLRLLPVLASGGLYGNFVYDDGVYFGSAVALVHGRIPYRDFLLLHPPGILYLLAPFAALGNLIGTASAFAVARVAMMALGAANTMLVMMVAGTWTRRAALLSGLLYAVLPIAVRVERTTWLIAPQNTLLLLALLVLARAQAAGVAISPRRGALAGGLLGLAFGFQIWGVVTIGIVLAWLVVHDRRVPGGRVAAAAAFAAGAAVAAAALWLPFLIVAGEPLVRYTVVDQLGRAPRSGAMIDRFLSVIGIPRSGVGRSGVPAALLVSLVAGLIAAVGWGARRRPTIRLPALLAGAQFAVLFVVPPFAHYPGWMAPAASLALGGTAAALLQTDLQRRVRWVAKAGFGVALVLLLVLSGRRGTSTRIDAAAIRADVAGARCVVADSPVLLLEIGTFARDLDAGCAYLLDPSGLSYDVGRGSGLPRREDPAYQDALAAYYTNAGAVLLVGTTAVAFSPSTWAEIQAAFPHAIKRGKVTVLVP